MEVEPVPEQQNELAVPGSGMVELVRAVLGKGLSFRFRATGYSMHPFIRNGDIVKVAPVANGFADVGDVLACELPVSAKFVVHRVVRKNGDRLLVQGDGSPEPDGWITRENILGRIENVERDGRAVCVGLGSERYLIAVLNDRRVLGHFLSAAGKFRSAVRRVVR